MCGRSAPLSDLTSLYIGTPGQCLVRIERQYGSTSQKKACSNPAHERPRSHMPTPENRLPTRKKIAPVAILRLGAGARGPHMVDTSTTRAFDAQIKSCTFCKHLVAMSASDFVVLMYSRHFNCPFTCTPESILICVARSSEHNRRRKLCTMASHRVGPWFGALTPSRWGRLLSPPPLPKIYAAIRISGGHCRRKSSFS